MLAKNEERESIGKGDTSSMSQELARSFEKEGHSVVLRRSACQAARETVVPFVAVDRRRVAVAQMKRSLMFAVVP